MINVSKWPIRRLKYLATINDEALTEDTEPDYEIRYIDIGNVDYRLQKISEGSISLRDGKAEPLDGPREVGSGAGHDEDVPLSSLIEVINERFGTDFTDADQLFFDQIIEAAIEDGSLREAAAVNPEEKFALLFSGLLETLFIERMEQNEDIFARFMNERDFQNLVSEWISNKVYNRFRRPGN